MNRDLLLAAAIIAVIGGMIAGVAVLSSGQHVIGADGSSRVLNCTSLTYSADNTCHPSRIDAVPRDCNVWFAGRDRSQLSCNWSSEGVSDVTLVTDPGNFITAPFADAAVEEEMYYHWLSWAWDLEVLPGGRMLVTQQNGTVSVIRPGRGTERVGAVDVRFDDRYTVGLMGAAVHPDYSANRFIYLYYTVPAEQTELDLPLVSSRISRFRLVNGSLRNETVILDDIRGAHYHAGGRLEIGPDGKLYATTGATGKNRSPRSADTHVGKILRMDLDGTVPADNPYGNHVYSLGHRNPQGLAWNPETSVLWSSEHGPNRYDEINRIGRGEDYGWPDFRCDERQNEAGTDASVRMPERCFKNWTLAPSGMTFIDADGHPWDGDLFVAGLRGKHLHRVTIADGAVTGSDIFYVMRRQPPEVQSRRFRDVEYWNGSLWVLEDTSGALIRLTPGQHG